MSCYTLEHILLTIAPQISKLSCNLSVLYDVAM